MWANLAGGLSLIGLIFLFLEALISAPAGRLDLDNGELKLWGAILVTMLASVVDAS